MTKLTHCKNIVEKNKIPVITIDDKRKIVDKVKILSKDVHMEIYYFLKKNNSSYTLNRNGVFFNLNNINDEFLHNLSDMVNFYNKNEKKLKKSYLERYCNKNENSENSNPGDSGSGDSSSRDSSSEDSSSEDSSSEDLDEILDKGSILEDT